LFVVVAYENGTKQYFDNDSCINKHQTGGTKALNHKGRYRLLMKKNYIKRPAFDKVTGLLVVPL
jgi:predicted metal-dependent phosphoesterase TrpH